MSSAPAAVRAARLSFGADHETRTGHTGRTRARTVRPAVPAEARAGADQGKAGA